MYSSLKRYYLQQMSRPGIVGMFVNPFYFARRGLLLAVRDFAYHVSGRVLDVGCGSRPYEALFNASEYVGLELDTPENRLTKKADLFYDGKAFPCGSQSFDTVVCNQVLEHVFEPDAFVAEIRRVLKVNGRLLLTVPFVWDEHEQPRDFGRYTSFGLRALLERNGLQITNSVKTMGDIRSIFQMLTAYVYKKTIVSSPYASLLVTLLLIAPFNVIGSILYYVTPNNSDFYLDNVVVAEKVASK
jgi:SAM-dependent methyltransferase